jgi:hypothetical protein
MASPVALCRRALAAAAGVRASAPSSAPARQLYVKVHGAGGNASGAGERLQSKNELDGLEKMLAKRKRFIKPHLQRQLNAKGAVYNKAKGERIRLVEELMLDRKICPF